MSMILQWFDSDGGTGGMRSFSLLQVRVLRFAHSSPVIVANVRLTLLVLLVAWYVTVWMRWAAVVLTELLLKTGERKVILDTPVRINILKLTWCTFLFLKLISIADHGNSLGGYVETITLQFGEPVTKKRSSILSRPHIALPSGLLVALKATSWWKKMRESLSSHFYRSVTGKPILAGVKSCKRSEKRSPLTHPL